MMYQRIVVGANELCGISAKTKTKGVAGKWQVNLGPIRPVAGKSADKAWIDNIVSFITREIHICHIFGKLSTA